MFLCGIFVKGECYQRQWLFCSPFLIGERGWPLNLCKILIFLSVQFNLLLKLAPVRFGALCGEGLFKQKVNNNSERSWEPNPINYLFIRSDWFAFPGYRPLPRPLSFVRWGAGGLPLDARSLAGRLHLLRGMTVSQRASQSVIEPANQSRTNGYTLCKTRIAKIGGEYKK